MERITNVLGDASVGRYRFLVFLESCFLIVVFFLSARWLLAEVALMAEGTGPAGILTPQLESEPGLCSAHRWLSNPLIHSHGMVRRSGRSVSGISQWLP